MRPIAPRRPPAKKSYRVHAQILILVEIIFGFVFAFTDSPAAFMICALCCAGILALIHKEPY